MSSTHHLANGESEPPRPTVLTSSASIKVRRKNSISHSRVDSEVDDFIHMLHGSDPIRLELSRLENELRDKERELGDAHAEIKGLKHSDRLKEKAVEELTDELNKVDGKLKATEAVLESKNLEIRKLNEEKKAALAAQFAAEATLRRVHAAQKDDDMPPIEAIIAPLEAELKLARQEVAKLQDDNRALDRLTKSKEAALLEAEKTVKVALVKASMVDDLQNKNQELMKQIEICQEENKILDKMHRQKVAEVEKLTQTVRELEEAVLAGGAAANAVRDYQRKVQEMNEEKKTVDRELARAKVTANRVAVVVANEWKDASDKVMPVKQWIEERKQYQGEMQLLRDKLAVAERTAKAEAQLKEKYQLRFKVLEERLKTSSSSSSSRIMSEARSASSGRARRQSLGGAESLSRLPSNGLLSKRVVTNSPSHVLKSNSAAMLVKNAKISSNIFDGGDKATEFDQKQPAAINDTQIGNEDGKPAENMRTEGDDSVSGALYDMLQKEVITLRKACSEKDQSLKDKDNAIEISKPLKLNSNKGSMPFAFIFLFFVFFHMKSSLTWLEFCELNQMLSKKVDTLSKAMEVEAKKMRRQVQTMEKEVTAIRASKESDQRARRLSTPRGMNASPARIARNTRNL